MATQLYVPGPAYVQVGTGVSGALEHLGWTESGPEIQVNILNEDVITDLGGPKLPTDVINQGKEALITLDLVRYDAAVISKVLAGLNGMTEGAIAAGELGSLMIGQGFSFRLLIGCPYQSIPYFSGQQSAYNFPTAFPIDGIATKVGTNVKKYRLQFRAIVGLIVSGGITEGILYNNSVTGVAALT